MKHRYIFCGVVWENPEINNFRLISNTRYSMGSLVRVNIPDDLKLSHYPGDGYSTTFDTRTLENLGCDCYILFNGKWRKFNWLKQIEPHEWFEALEHIFGVYDCYDDKVGYTDNQDTYIKIFHSPERLELSKKCSRGEATKHYPPLREDKIGLKLKVNLDDISWFRHDRKGGWLDLYDKYKAELEKNPKKEIWCQ